MNGEPDYQGIVNWSYLRPHYENGVLFFVDPALDLAAVAEAIADDNKQQVAAWLEAGDLVKIGKLHADQWETAAPDFEARVVSPFVLCRPLG